jgi:hypothetical protein
LWNKTGQQKSFRRFGKLPQEKKKH